MATVGLLDAFRVLLIRPIFDRVLKTSSPSHDMQLFKVLFSGNTVDLQHFVFFFQAEDCIRVCHVTGVQTCALPICYLSGMGFVLLAGGGLAWLLDARTRGV